MQFALDRFERYGQLDAPVIVFVPFARDEVFKLVGNSPSTVIRVSASSFTKEMQQVRLFIDGQCGAADREDCTGYRCKIVIPYLLSFVFRIILRKCKP